MASMHLSYLLRTAACLTAAAAIGAASAGVHASTVVTDPGGRQLRNNGSGNFGGTLGYDLTVGAEDAQVTHLGVYDAPGSADKPNAGAVGDGLEQSAVVGVYRTSDRQLIAQATVPAGEEGELVEGFRYVELDDPVTVKAGETYRVVMGLNSGGNGFLNYGGGSAGPTMSEDFEVDTNAHHSTQGGHAKLVFPAGVRSGSPYVGPNFRYTGGAPVPPPAPIEPTEAPGDRLKNIAGLPGEVVLTEDFEQVEGALPQGWAMVPQTDRNREDGIHIEAPGAGYAGHSMKVGSDEDIRRADEFGGLNYTLPEPADRVAFAFDVKTEAQHARATQALEIFTFGPGSVEATQLRMRIHPEMIEQYGGIQAGWVSIPLGRAGAPEPGLTSPWYRIRLVVDRVSQGIDVYISEPDQAELPATPVATLPANDLDQPIAAIRFGVSNLPGVNHSFVDNIAIRTGSEIPAPGEPGRAFPLWTGDTFPRSFGDVEYPRDIEYHIMGRRGRTWKWFHGTAIEFHEGKLYATWGANTGRENTAGEVVVVTESSDGGKTWSELEVLADGDGKGGTEYSNSHGTLLSHDGKLWGFFQHWAGGWDGRLSTEAFILNEETGKWESQGIVATKGWPLDRPKQTADGNWIMGVSGFRMRRPAAMISHGDDLTKWDTIAIPTTREQAFPETSLIVDGNDVWSITRWNGGRALASISHDGGRTWAMGRRSNLPMVTSKPDSGTLSTGQWFAVVNMEDRDALMIAVGEPGEHGLSKLYKVRYGAPPIGGHPYEGDTMPYEYAYPYAMEHDGKLYVTYSVGKAGCEVAIIPIESLKAD